VSKTLRVLVSMALLGWVGSQTNWADVGQAFARLRLGYWLAAVGLLAVTQIGSALRWQYLSSALGFRRSLRQLTGIYFIGMYFNLMLPTAVGGDVVRAWYLDGGSGRRLAAFATVFLDRLSGLLVLLSLACVGLALSPLDLPPWVSWFVWGSAGGALLAVAVLPLVTGRGGKGTARRQRLSEALKAVRSPRVLVCTTLLSLWVQAANVGVVWLVGLAIDAPAVGAYYWVVVPMVALLTMLPVSINGIGVREKGMALFLAPLGVAEGTAMTLSLLWFAVTAVTSLAGGVVYLFGRFPKPAAAVTGQPSAVGEEPSLVADQPPAPGKRRAA
jgi:glycosyltransferase 2 family protein